MLRRAVTDRGQDRDLQPDSPRPVVPPLEVFSEPRASAQQHICAMPRSHAIASEDSHKGEDATSVLEANGIAAFAIFDGHGGKTCSQACADLGSSGVLPMLLSEADTSIPSDERIADALWTADATHGTAMVQMSPPCHAGSTATVLLLSDRQRECALAWCGDSTGMVVDMKGPGRIMYVTPNHNPDVSTEVDQMNYLAAVAKQVRKVRKKAAGGDDEDDERGPDKASIAGLDEPPTSEEVAEAMSIVEGPIKDVLLVHRALCREKLIMKHIPKGGK